MSIEILGGHVNTSDNRRRRRIHSAEFKAKVVAACRKPGMSMAAVALANGLNANLLRRWVVAEEQAQRTTATTLSTPPARVEIENRSFIPLQVERPLATRGQEINIELRRGAMVIKITWPVAAAADCAAWLHELLR